MDDDEMDDDDEDIDKLEEQLNADANVDAADEATSAPPHPTFLAALSRLLAAIQYVHVRALCRPVTNAC